MPVDSELRKPSSFKVIPTKIHFPIYFSLFVMMANLLNTGMANILSWDDKYSKHRTTLNQQSWQLNWKLLDTLIHEIFRASFNFAYLFSCIQFLCTCTSHTSNFRAHHTEGKQYKALHMQLHIYLPHLSHSFYDKIRYVGDEA